MSETWEKMFCSHCKAKNFVCLGDMSDDTKPDIDAVICHQCGKRSWLVDPMQCDICDEIYYEYMPGYSDDPADYEPRPNGESGPWTREEILEHVANAEQGKPVAE